MEYNMNVKGLISKLLVLQKSATFVLVVTFFLTNCHQVLAKQNDTVQAFLYFGPPVTTTSGSGTGPAK